MKNNKSGKEVNPKEKLFFFCFKKIFVKEDFKER